MTVNQAKQNRRKRQRLRISSLITAAWGKTDLATEPQKRHFGAFSFDKYHNDSLYTRSKRNR